MSAESGEESDDVPMSSLASPSKRKRSQVNYAEDDDEEAEFQDDEAVDNGGEDGDEDVEDDEDDVPLSALASPSPKKNKKTTSGKENGKKTAPKKKATTNKKSTSSSASVASSAKGNGNASYRSASAALYGSECEKGMLIQRLLCRWWYAIEWPHPADIPNEPPPHYDPLDGFPGVFVCTEGEEVGTIKDFRNKSECPNFVNMAKKSAAELQELLVKALTEQRKQLIDTEGTGTDTQKELDKYLKWASKVKTTAADREAAKILKMAKFTLD